MASFKYIVINSADRDSGTVNDFYVSIPYGIKIKSVKLLSLILPNTVTSPTVPQYINLSISKFEDSVISSNNTVYTFTVPFINGQVNLYRGDMYPQEFYFPRDTYFYTQQFNVKLLDKDNTAVTFSGGDWSFVMEVRY